MARRIVYAEKSGTNNYDKLFVDQRIDIDWKSEDYSEVTIVPPFYLVGLWRINIDGHPYLSDYGTIKNPEDIAWVKGATHGAYLAGPAHVKGVKHMVVRVHNIGLKRDGRQGFEIEILTGEDAKTLIDKEKLEQAIATFKEVWWLVPIGIGILWWIV